VDVHGSNGAGQPDFVRVAFYANNGTLPADDPLTVQSPLTPSVGLDTGNFKIALSPPVELAAGTYWLSVQAIEGGGDWIWTARSSQNLHEGALRESGAHGYSCPVWMSFDDCFHSTIPDPDMSFRLIGSVVGGGSPAPPATPKDTTPPVLTASAPKTESVKGGFVTVTDTTNEPATDTATGTVNVSGGGKAGAAKTYKLRKATARHAAGTVKLKLRIPTKPLKAIRHRRKGVARVKIVSQDAAGNSTTHTLRIRLKP
jgi:hypothetical protein